MARTGINDDGQTAQPPLDDVVLNAGPIPSNQVPHIGMKHLAPPKDSQPIPGSRSADVNQVRRNSSQRLLRTRMRSSSPQSSLPSASAQVALTALQYLPMPLVVCDAAKIIVLANEAMGKFLGVDDLDGPGRAATGYAGELLNGAHVSRIGLDLAQDGQPMWVSWEKLLDSLAARSSSASKTRNASAAKAPAETTRRSETSVDVVLTAFSAVSGAQTSSLDAKTPVVQSPNRRINANMIATAWSVGSEGFFTLTFTAPSSAATASSRNRHSPNSSRSSSRASAYSSSRDSTKRSSFGDVQSTSDQQIHQASNANLSPPPLLPSASPLSSERSLSEKPAPITAARKIGQLKDAILNTMSIPVIAVWNDRSIALPNKAARQLASDDDANPLAGEADQGIDIFSRIKLLTPDFERRLEDAENPFYQVCYNTDGYKTYKVGLIDPKTGEKRHFDVSGEAIRDHRTGKVSADLILLKDVTEYTTALETQSAESAEQFRIICDTMPQLMWTTDAHGNHDYFSKRWYSYTGQQFGEGHGNEWIKVFHPEDMPKTLVRWNHSLATGEEYITEYRCRRHDGVWRWMLGRALPLRDKSGSIVRWYGSCTDIDEIVEARTAAREARETLLQVIEHASVTVWVCNKDLKITFFEGHILWDEANSHTGADFVGKNALEAFSHFSEEKNYTDHKNAIEAILQGKSKLEVYESKIDNTGLSYRTRLAPIYEKTYRNGEVELTIDGVVGMSMDVTELTRKEKENVDLLANEAAAKEASRLKSSFLANMSHEIRTPIAHIIGLSELMFDTEMTEEQTDLVENAQRSANGLLTVINDILDFSKIESGRLDIEEVSFSLSVVIEDVSRIITFAAERRNLKFTKDIELGAGPDLVLLGDPGRVRQILTNLLTNSIKFTSEGSVCLSARINKEDHETLEVTFEVTDTGIGIEEEVVKKGLFTPFGQADSSTARKFGGTGLGLTICQNLVTLMHGTIGLESTLGVGTRAYFTIPFSKPQYQGTAPKPVELQALPDRLQSELSLSCRSQTPPPSKSPPTLERNTSGNERSIFSRTQSDQSVEGLTLDREKCHILVVEDNAINQKIALKTLRKLNFSTNAVWNGKEALEYLAKADTAECPRPDIILMDVQMPILDGVKTTQAIRCHDPFSSDPEIRSIPIIAMTASAIQGDREKCERAGMDDYLAKPVKRATLEKMLVKWLLKNERIPDRHGKKNSCSSQDSHLSQAELQRLLPTVSIGKPTIHQSHNDEKALYLRDEKLIAAGDTSFMKPLTPKERERDDATSYFSLTKENVEKFNDITLLAKDPSVSPKHQSMETNPSPPVLVQKVSAASSDIGSLPTMRDHAHSRKKLPRNDSEWSESTVKPARNVS